jgi:hypothetical protein
LKQEFWRLVGLGGELRRYHLLEHPQVNELITQYPVAGNNIVDKTRFADGKVHINATQYFESVPENTWNFYIGGYQPAQKWLKDRKGRELSYEDILHLSKDDCLPYKDSRIDEGYRRQNRYNRSNLTVIIS